MDYLNTKGLTRPPVTVIDAIMGSGKTTWMIEYMNRMAARDQFHGGQPCKFIYVTPLLSETDRIRSACPIADFKNPVPRHGSKFYDFKTLLREGQNIATTHSLFSQLDRECYDLIKDQGYTLVIDEALNCLEVFDGLSKADREMLFNSDMVFVEEETKKLRWNHELHGRYTGKFEQIKSLCDNGNLVVYSSNGSRTVLIWEFSVDFLFSFRDVFILTYLFKGSPMSLYLVTEGFSFDHMSIQVDYVGDQVTRNIVNYDDVDEGAIKTKLRSLISIYEGPRNKVGERIADKGSYPFTSTWFDTELRKGKMSRLTKIRNTTVKFFEVDAKTPSALNGWTTLKKAESELRGKGYAKGFIPINSKATNDYAQKTSLAYLANVYYQTIIKQFFQSKGMVVYEDLYALSEMLQWVFRSAIRNDKPITIFIPSPRMRQLLKDWLETDNYEDLVMQIDESRETQMVESKMRREGVEVHA